MNAAQQPITITAEMTPVINYALYQNELRVMRCVTVENTRETALERVTLSVSSVPAIIMPYTITLDYIPACNTFRVTDVELLLNVDELANLTEKMTCAVTVSLSDSSGELASQTTEISVLAFDEWQGAGIYPELLTAPQISSENGRATPPLTPTSRRTSTACFLSRRQFLRQSANCSLSTAPHPRVLRRGVSASVCATPFCSRKWAIASTSRCCTPHVWRR